MRMKNLWFGCFLWYLPMLASVPTIDPSLATADWYDDDPELSGYIQPAENGDRTQPEEMDDWGIDSGHFSNEFHRKYPPYLRHLDGDKVKSYPEQDDDKYRTNMLEGRIPRRFQRYKNLLREKGFEPSWRKDDNRMVIKAILENESSAHKKDRVDGPRGEKDINKEKVDSHNDGDLSVVDGFGILEKIEEAMKEVMEESTNTPLPSSSEPVPEQLADLVEVIEGHDNTEDKMWHFFFADNEEERHEGSGKAEVKYDHMLLYAMLFFTGIFITVFVCIVAANKFGIIDTTKLDTSEFEDMPTLKRKGTSSSTIGRNGK